ncbi:type II toxin-antitoxin system Phd/YefM family antitoxin [Chitinimonas arctica]|uniref:Antitoxin n=1 Tax=Chitinimonas arctica TaxID=2594795 RepID=A0A516SL90_9NEIS|nr:type II toxin-antitoxin system Phd/YefM family antitoxin [Chitinimonas arctica]
MDKTRSDTSPQQGYWVLQEAKERFSELVRRVHSEGPQRVIVHGRDEVVVVAAEEYRRLQYGRTGGDLIEAIQASPYRDLELNLPHAPSMLVRGREL